MLATTCRWLRFAVLLMLYQQQHTISVQAQDPALALEETVVKLVEQVEPSVVSIARVKPVPHDPDFLRLAPLERIRREQASPPIDSEHPDFQPNEFGAGIIISPPGSDERLVLTNYHVVRGGPVYPSHSTDDHTSLDIHFADRRSCKASIIAADPRSDLAVLHLHLQEADIRPTDLKPLDWSTSPSGPIRKGMFVVMLGNPHALARDGSASVSWGLVSNIARRPLPRADDESAAILYRLGNLLQIDGRLNLGTSGGPVLGLKGDLLGLTTSLAVADGYDKSAGFAIPFDDHTRRIVKSLVAGHEVEYGILGINRPRELLPRELRERNIVGVTQASAALASEISHGSPAEQAGLRPGDVVLRVANETVLSHYDLMRVVGLHAPESVVDLLICHKGHHEPSPIKVRLGKWPVQDDEGIVETKPRFSPWRGLSVDYPTGRYKYIKEESFSATYRHAVVVTKIDDESAAHSAGLQPGNFISHVNKTAVQTPAEFHAAIKSATGPVTLRLYAERMNEGRTVIVRE